MAAYVARRFLQAILILIGVTLVAFFLLYVIPADPAQMMVGRAVAGPGQIAAVRHQLGLDLPFFERYFHYLGNLAQGNLGRSYLQKTEVSALIWSRLPATLLLIAGAIFFEIVIGLTMGLLAAIWRNGRIDQGLMVASFVFASAPQFVVGILLLYVFAVHLDWFPMGGYGSLSHLILPALTLGILGAGWYARLMRSSMIDVLRQDFIRTAKAKGLAPVTVIVVHALPNAILPVVALIGSDIAYFMSQTVVVESVFGWPGIGQLAWQAIQRIDIPIIMGVTVITACAAVIGNFLADLIAPFIDPRIKMR
ncbi:MAG: ABC transporter permease [Bauldia sp.]|nr:ABC transporter permease [Bauldia sp.]